MASIQRRPDGVWRARYRDTAGREHARHFRRKVDAQRWLDETTAALVTGAYVTPAAGRATIASVAAVWLAGHPEWSAATLARNRSIVDRHILPAWGAVRLVDVTHEHLQAWVAQLTGQGLAGGTVRKITGVMSSILAQAVAGKRLAANPMATVARPRQTLARRRYLTGPEVEQLAAYAGPNGDVILTLAYCGLRIGELAALRLVDVDQLRRRLRVEASVTEVNGQLVRSAPKDRQRRTVPYPAFLDGQIAARMAGRDAGEPLFPSPRGGVLRVRNMRRDWFDAAATDAGLGGLVPHELRHTAASLAVAAGASVLAVQRMLGHDRPSTTLDVYSDLFDADLDQVADRLTEARARHAADHLRTTDSAGQTSAE